MEGDRLFRTYTNSKQQIRYISLLTCDHCVMTIFPWLLIFLCVQKSPFFSLLLSVDWIFIWLYKFGLHFTRVAGLESLILVCKGRTQPYNGYQSSPKRSFTLFVHIKLRQKKSIKCHLHYTAITFLLPLIAPLRWSQKKREMQVKITASSLRGVERPCLKLMYIALAKLENKAGIYIVKFLHLYSVNI